MRFLLIFLFIAALLSGSYSYATEYTFEITWAIEETVDIELAGFRLYDLQQNEICETANSAAREMACTVDITGPEATYTLVSYSSDGTESDPSDPFTIVFGETPSLGSIINWEITSGSLAVNFNAKASTGLITRYSWNFGDGTIDDNNATPSHTFAVAGIYTVVLTVKDENGAEATTSQQLTLSRTPGRNQAPTASLVITSAVIGTLPLTVSFDAGRSSDPEGSALTYSWDFGDGTIATGGETENHQYTEAGTYIATITVTDSQGAIHSTTSQPIMVKAGHEAGSNAMPTASITASRTSGPTPIAVTFTGAGSTPSRQDGTITQYSWDFGDGSTGTGREEQHTFTDPGNYTAQLTVTDSTGKQAVTTKSIVAQDLNTQNIAPILIQVYKLLILND